MQQEITNMIDKTKLLFPKKNHGKSFIQETLSVENLEPVYNWTRSPTLISQYRNLVNEVYYKELSIDDAFTKISYKDIRSHFYIGTKKNIVMGGVRLTVNDPFHRYTLPSEKIGFSFQKLYAELDLSHSSFAEVTKFAVLTEYRNSTTHYKKAFSAFKDLCHQISIKYVFILGTKDRIRLYNAMSKSYFNVYDSRAIDVSEWPDYKHLEVEAVCYTPKYN
jgi:hypothetical protein